MKKLNLVLLASLVSSSVVMPGLDVKEYVSPALKIAAAGAIVYGSYLCGGRRSDKSWIENSGKTVGGTKYNVSAQQ
jgi:hypothetical protein